MQRRTFFLLISAVLVSAAGYFFRTQTTAGYVNALQAEIESNLVSSYIQIDREAESLLADSGTVTSAAWDRSQYQFVCADSTGIIAWNGNSYFPEPSVWNGEETITFLTNQRGDFLIKKWKFDKKVLANVLVLRERYPITNSFLSPAMNSSIFAEKEMEIVSPAGSVGELISLNGKPLFRIASGPIDVRDSRISFGFFMLSLILLCAGIFRVCEEIKTRFGADLSLLSMLAALYGVRSLMVKAGVPALYAGSDIFDPKVFASSPLNASLGDLFLNGFCVFLVILYLFRNFRSMKCVRWILAQGMVLRFLSAIVCLLLAFFAILFSFNFVEVIYHNSTQTLDITQSASVNLVRTTAFLSVLTGTLSAFLLIHILISLTRHLLSDRLVAFLGCVVFAAALFVLQYVLSENDNQISLATGLVFFPLLWLFGFDRLEFKFSFRFFIYLLFSLTIFSIHHSLAARMFYTERQVQDQFRYAKDFLTERDVLGEYLLDQARQKIAEDQFIQTRMASPFFTKTSVVDKVKRLHLNSYFDRYEVAISTRSLFDTSRQVSAQRQREGVFLPTGYRDITYASRSTGETVRRYHVSIPVYYQRPVGTVELDLTLKRVVPDNVFPELLVDNRFNQIYRNRDFSYAILRNGTLVNSFGDFNYEHDFSRQLFDDPALFRTGVSDGAYFHVGIDESGGSAAIVSAQLYSWSSFVTNVSFWFVLGLTFLLLVQGAFGLLALTSGSQFAYTARIQLFMFLAFVMPVVAVTITTVTLMGRSSEAATSRDFLDRSVSAAQRIATLFSNDTTRESSRLESWIVENAAYSKTDISVYSPNGRLLATSQPALFGNQLLSTRINREALQRIALQGQRETVTNEQIGTLQYSCAYAAVLSPLSGKLEAVVSLPFFESAAYLQEGRILILSNILQVFVVVFLVFSLLSFLAAGNLTFPLRFIARKLRQTTFTGENKPLTWNAADEIGMLVSEYNKMVRNLEESKKALAKSEKESAWREMAKQVAHEIKNPLTPMKLTLQQMERGLQSGDLAPEKSQKSVDILLKQVEILNAIASSFSTFARMPAPTPQHVELGALLSETSSLFSAGDDGTVSLKTPAELLWVSIDPTSFGRAISNILINAFQAKVEGRATRVEIHLTRMEDMAVISIADNGKGIPKDLQQRIFEPHFTTKESGSGLGLAMARQIMLQANGQIRFDSTMGHGTTFTIELPLLPAK